MLADASSPSDVASTVRRLRTVHETAPSMQPAGMPCFAAEQTQLLLQEPSSQKLQAMRSGACLSSLTCAS